MKKGPNSSRRPDFTPELPLVALLPRQPVTQSHKVAKTSKRGSFSERERDRERERQRERERDREREREKIGRAHV